VDRVATLGGERMYYQLR